MWNMLISPITGLLDTFIKRVFPDPEAQAAARLELAQMMQQGAANELETHMKVIVAEAQSKSWLARSWRPITMLCFVGIIVNNYVAIPYLTLFGIPTVWIDMPEDLWDLIKIGLGGYVVGRSGEKMISSLTAAGVIGKKGL